MISTPVENLLEVTGSKFRLVTLGAQRARQINAYFGQLGDGLGRSIPPQITSRARKPVSIAFEEIDAGKIVAIDRPPEPEPTEEELQAVEAAELGEAEDASGSDDAG